jgi:hypothetical protein
MSEEVIVPMRRVNPLYGWKWLSAGWGLFKKNPPLWLSIMALYFFTTLFLMAIPGIGPLIFFMIVPGVQAGCLIACRDLEAGKELEISHLLAGFKAAAKPLVALGSFSFAAAMITLFFLVLAWKEQFGEILQLVTADTLDFAAIETAALALTTPLVIAVGIFTLFAMAMWFAPALIVFRQEKPLQALYISLRAMAANFWPFLVYSLLLILLDIAISLVARIVVSLIAGIAGGMAGNLAFVLMAFPIVFLFFALIIGGIYEGYKDIFEYKLQQDDLPPIA